MMNKIKQAFSNKKFRWIAGSALLLVVLILNSLLPKEGAKKTTTSPTPTASPRSSVSAEKKIKISDVEVNNFLNNAPVKEGDLHSRFVVKPSYQLLYFPDEQLFLVSILAHPFDKVRSQAEQELLSSLGITAQQACKLNVAITTPREANPEQSGKVYKLSFCE